MPGPADRPAPPVPAPPDAETIAALVRRALAEDIGTGDITTAATVPAGARARGRFIAREPCVVCGLPIARAVFAGLDARASWDAPVEEGSDLPRGATIAVVSGGAAAILSGERTALNLLQRLSGIATMARRCVREIAGTGAIILDTRKTTPTLRAFEKYAVRVGGASNHRTGLYDAVLIKDNHIAAAGGVAEAVRRAAAAGHAPASIEVEVESHDELIAALAAGAGRILLDNRSVEEVREAVRLIAGRAAIEVSGGLRPGALRPYAEAGAHYLSLGSLTHSAPAVDIALEIEPVVA